MAKKNKNVKRRRLYTALTIVIFFIGLTYWFTPPVWRLSGDDFVVRLCFGNDVNKCFVVGPREKGWTNIEEISKPMLDSIITAEDARFYQHHGLDFTEIEKSIDKNFEQGRIARGASTITQQVIKMAFLTREKSYLRKAREAVGALIVEKSLEKDEILEWYVNLAEFGKDVYGVAAAADHYFQIKPEQITMQQAIHLALVLPNPRIWSAGLQEKELTDFGHKRFSQIASNLRQSSYITEGQWFTILATGNFGTPVKEFDSIVAQYIQDNGNKLDEAGPFPGEFHQQDSSESDR